MQYQQKQADICTDWFQLRNVRKVLHVFKNYLSEVVVVSHMSQSLLLWQAQQENYNSIKYFSSCQKLKNHNLTPFEVCQLWVDKFRHSYHFVPSSSLSYFLYLCFSTFLSFFYIFYSFISSALKLCPSYMFLFFARYSVKISFMLSNFNPFSFSFFFSHAPKILWKSNKVVLTYMCGFLK